MSFFVTGTDTGVGKTYVSCLLLRALDEAGLRASGFKPICCGHRDDVTALDAAGGAGLGEDAINPIWLRTPAAPYAACMIENRSINLEHIQRSYRTVADACDVVLVEGAGGWEVPITRDYGMADLAADLGLPVIVVVHNRLGALNHTALTVKAIAARGLPCAGIVLNHVDIERHSATITNRSILEEVLEVPILLDVMHGETEVDVPETIFPLLK